MTNSLRTATLPLDGLAKAIDAVVADRFLSAARKRRRVDRLAFKALEKLGSMGAVVSDKDRYKNMQAVTKLRKIALGKIMNPVQSFAAYDLVDTLAPLGSWHRSQQD